MPLGPIDVVWIGIIPGVLAALAMAICGRWSARPTVAWTVSVACGLVAGMIAQNVRVGWTTALEKFAHPRVAIDWLPWLVLVAAAIQLLSASVPRTARRWLLLVACVFAVTVPVRLLALSVYVTDRWSRGEKFAVAAAWAALLAIEWGTLALGRLNRQDLLRCGLLVVVGLGTSLTLAASGAITLGELGGVATATLLGTAGAALAFGRLAAGPSEAAGPLAVMLGGLILIGHFYAQLSLANVALLSVSLATAAGWLPDGWLLSATWRAALRAVLAMVPVAIAAGTAIARAAADAYS
jgi:hypothetical protein